MINALRRVALPVAVTMMLVNVLMLATSGWLWWQAEQYRADGTRAIEDIVFVARMSMLALVFAAVSGVAAGLAGILSMIPTEEPE